mmetsp:Transcript_37837/g.52535  ORF Transcript_37837/g.52535 Transcript_37837/m.52535 type:complete len:82 (+) Transcript_37837:316-561(+)
MSIFRECLPLLGTDYQSRKELLRTRRTSKIKATTMSSQECLLRDVDQRPQYDNSLQFLNHILRTLEDQQLLSASNFPKNPY